MKSRYLYLLSLALLASCSSPKYTYYFDSFNYNAGKKKAASYQEVALQGPEGIRAEELVASSEPVVLPVEAKRETTASEPTVRKTYVQMNKVERKALRQQLKAEIKHQVKAVKENVKSTHATKAMDKDLKLAAIFGAVGVVAMIIGGDVFWIIGGIALLIGVVFFVKWLIRQ